MRTFFYYFLFFLFSLGLLSTPAFAQPKGMKPVGGTAPAGTERRLALVIGNKDYPYLSLLRNPVNDANDMEAALKLLGFEVIKVINTDYRSMVTALNRFKDGLVQSDVAFFYYSGHGASYGGKNYLLPTDLNVDCLEQIEDQGLSLNRILSDISSKNVKNSFVVLDACRNIPKLRLCDNTKKDLTASGFVRPTNNPRGSMIIYATEEGTTADDNAMGKNGLFTASLLNYLTRPNLTIKQILDQASLEVEDRSNGRQTPGRYDKIYGDFYFMVTTVVEVNTTKKADLPPFMEMIQVPEGTFKSEKSISVKLNSFSMGKYEVTVGQFAEFVKATGYQTDAEKSGGSSVITSDWTFKSKEGIHWRHDERGELRPASQYNYPVIHVSLNDAVAFCKWLSKQEGKPYRLPTIDQWKYAAGGGSKNITNWAGTDDKTQLAVFGNFCDLNCGNVSLKDASQNDGYMYSAPVGTYKANRIGLHDMSGNVWEWCSNWGGDIQTFPDKNESGEIKGGSWFSVYVSIHPVQVSDFEYHFIDTGFRVVSPE